MAEIWRMDYERVVGLYSRTLFGRMEPVLDEHGRPVVWPESRCYGSRAEANALQAEMERVLKSASFLECAPRNRAHSGHT